MGRILRWARRGLAVSLVLGLGAGLWLAAVVPERIVLVTPEPSVLFEDAEGRYLAERSTDDAQHGFWPPAGPLPSKVVLATMAAEDVRFETHHGVDFRSVVRAVYQNIRNLRVVQGASTLAMQVVRLQDPGRRSLSRKAVEATVALGITHRFGREAVLRHYLTIAPYGNQNHGIVYAARRYMNKPLEDLTWAEAALLASLPRLPGRMNLYRANGWGRAERRARHVLTRLKEVGWIPEEDFIRAVTQLPMLRLLEKEKRPANALHAILALEREHRAGRMTEGPGSRNIVRTTIDLDIQRSVSELARRYVKGLRRDGAGNLAMVVVDRATGGVKAYLGSAEYGDVRSKGSIDYARVLRSPGSALKPFLFALGMWRKGFTAATLLTDVGLILDPKRGGYSIKNYDGGYLGPVLYRNALANSRNIPSIEVLQAVGVEAALEHFGDLGLVTRWKDPDHYGLSLALGSLHVTLFDLVRAYGVLAAGGSAFEMRWTDDPARVTRPRARILPEDIARQISLFLSDPMARLPSFPRLGWLEYPFPVAVKTGTSQGYRDAWCVAYSERYLVGAWVGHPDNFPMKRRSGADSAAMLVHRAMEELHPREMEGLGDRPFPPPRGFVARRIDMLSGKLAREDTPHVALEWFAPGTEPVEETDVYQMVTLDTATGRRAAPDCPPGRRQSKRFVSLEPRFARWAKISGFDLPPMDPADPLAQLRPDPELTIVTPCKDMRLMADPETPRDQATIALEASVTPPAPQVVWYLDGEPLAIADYPYTTRWKITPGEHILQVGLPYAPVRSAPVKVRVMN